MNSERDHKPGRWLTYRLPAICHVFARFPGVYAIYFGHELVYVGQSTDVGQRLASHKFRPAYSKEWMTPWGDIPSSTPLTVKVKRSVVRGDWAMWEIRLIARLRPKFNMQHRPRGST